MTENEAIKAIENDLEWHSKELQPKYKEVLRFTIKALEEIQQYRAIGTVERLKHLEEYVDTINKLCADYSAIGTIEEFKALKEKEERFDRNIRMFNEIGLEIRAKAIDEFAHQLKETLNQEFPSNYESTRPYFSLENARLSVDDIAEQMKAGE